MESKKKEYADNQSNETNTELNDEGNDDNFVDASDSLQCDNRNYEETNDKFDCDNFNDAKDNSFSSDERVSLNDDDNENEKKSDASIDSDNIIEDSDEESDKVTIDEDFIISSESKLTDEVLEERKLNSQNLKNEGNSLFKDGNHDEAISKYSKALDICPRKYSTDRSVLFSNRAACQFYLKQLDSGIEDSTKALDLNPNYVKAMLRRAQMYEQKDKLDEALADYNKCLELDPSIHQAREACHRLPDQIKVRNEKLKEEMMGKLKDLGNMCLKPFGLSTENFKLQQSDNGSYSINFQQNSS